jgi:hypothetical protein
MITFFSGTAFFAILTGNSAILFSDNATQFPVNGHRTQSGLLLTQTVAPRSINPWVYASRSVSGNNS